MNWDNAVSGLFNGLRQMTSLRINDARIAWDFIHTIQDLRDKQWDVIDDGSLCYQTISELMPTLENEWTVIWPCGLEENHDSQQQ